MARLSDLSQELIDLIIDHLNEDHRSLVSCSLLAHSWLFRSHRHLFKKLSLKGDGKTIRRFVSSAQRIAPVVKELRLSSTDPIALDSSIFSELLKALPALKSVVLSEVRIRRFDDERQYWDIASLDYVELAYKDIPPRDLVRLLASFSHTEIRVVVLECASKSLRVPEKYDLSGYTSHGQWRITDLRIMHNIGSESAWELLHTMVDPTVLRHLTLGAGAGGKNGDKVTAFMKKFGPGLQTLQLQLTVLWTPPRLYEPILSCCTSLNSLSVLLLCKRMVTNMDIVTRRLDEFTLSTLTDYVLPHIPHTIPHVTLSVPRESPLAFGQTLLERFLAAEPQVLARAEQNLLRLDALERVDIVLGSGARAKMPKHLRERIEEAFSVLHATGKLRFPSRDEAELVWLVRPDALDWERRG